MTQAAEILNLQQTTRCKIQAMGGDATVASEAVYASYRNSRPKMNSWHSAGATQRIGRANVRSTFAGSHACGREVSVRRLRLLNYAGGRKHNGSIGLFRRASRRMWDFKPLIQKDRRGGGAVERTGLENRQGFTAFVSSNLTLSAKT